MFQSTLVETEEHLWDFWRLFRVNNGKWKTPHLHKSVKYQNWLIPNPCIRPLRRYAYIRGMQPFRTIL